MRSSWKPAIQVVVWILLPVVVQARPIPAPATAAELLAAPVVLVGQVQETFLLIDGFPTESATVEVRETLIGAITSDTIRIEGRPSPRSTATGIDRLYSGGTFLFFLKPIEGTDQFTGIVGDDGLVQIDRLPPGDLQHMSPDDLLRTILRSNTEGRRACELLVDMYDPEQDRSYFLDHISDDNILLRGSSVLALCRETGTSEPIYRAAVNFLSAAASSNMTGSVAHKLARCMKETSSAQHLSKERLLEWLSGNIPLLQEMAIVLVREREERDLIEMIAEIMVNTDNPRLPYQCIKTLSVLTGRIGPSYDLYKADPRQVVFEEYRRAMEQVATSGRTELE